VSKIGRGGFAEIYKAINIENNQKVAIKALMKK
jgi:serine/threonine protein kinase